MKRAFYTLADISLAQDMAERAQECGYSVAEALAARYVSPVTLALHRYRAAYILVNLIVPDTMPSTVTILFPAAGEAIEKTLDDYKADFAAMIQQANDMWGEETNLGRTFTVTA